MAEPARTGPLASPGFHLWTASLRWAAEIAAALEPLGLTHVQFFILGSVTWLTKTRGAAPTQSDVWHFNGMDAMMTSKVVRSLASRDLLRREDDPNDARAWHLHVTAEGAALFPRAVAIVREVDAKFFAPLSPRLAEMMKDLKMLSTPHGGPTDE